MSSNSFTYNAIARVVYRLCGNIDKVGPDNSLFNRVVIAIVTRFLAIKSKSKGDKSIKDTYHNLQQLIFHDFCDQALVMNKINDDDRKHRFKEGDIVFSKSSGNIVLVLSLPMSPANAKSDFYGLNIGNTYKEPYNRPSFIRDVYPIENFELFKGQVIFDCYNKNIS